jgi:CubicO group peptidase (beta-lactamase class C family)
MPDIHGTVASGFEAVRKAFEANFADHAETGAGVCVYHKGQVVVDLWGGVADPGTGRAWRRDTLQAVYSATKSATAACAHLLVQRGRLDLDAPVADYWPEFAAAGKARIPVRWLLSHQAGLPVLDHPLPVAEALAWEPMVTALAAQRPAWEPGTRHGYHGMTYGWLVGEVVRRVSGRSLGTFFAEEIAAPLGLDFWIGLPTSELARVSRIIAPAADAGAGIDLDALPEGMREVLAAYADPTSLSVRAVMVTSEPLDLNNADQLTAEIPAVNGVCTARALARFYAALIGHVDGVRILDAETLAAATAEQASGPDHVLRVPTRPALGFGLPLPDMPWYAPTAFGFPGHGGSLGYADPATGIAFGYVMNRLNIGMTPDPRATELVRAVHASLRDVDGTR